MRVWNIFVYNKHGRLRSNRTPRVKGEKNTNRREMHRFKTPARRFAFSGGRPRRPPAPPSRRSHAQGTAAPRRPPQTVPPPCTPCSGARTPCRGTACGTVARAPPTVPRWPCCWRASVPSTAGGGAACHRSRPSSVTFRDVQCERCGVSSPLSVCEISIFSVRTLRTPYAE